MGIRTKVLLQRSHATSDFPTEDVNLMQQLADALKALGCNADTDLTGQKDPAKYDLVHLFNFSDQARLCSEAARVIASKVPFLVSTMYEDWPLYAAKAEVYKRAFADYISKGQPSAAWPKYKELIEGVRPDGICDNTFVATHSKALVACGKQEAFNLERDYPGARVRNIAWPVPCPLDVVEKSLFGNRLGVKDYVLSVGALNQRNNQLMLLKALEDVDLPLILIKEGVGDDPEYLKLCAKFTRKRGTTIILNALPPAELASAYAGCSVYVSAAWYPTTGVAALTAAGYGSSIIAADRGILPEYLLSHSQYFGPDDEQKLKELILSKIQHPFSGKAVPGNLSRQTWKDCAEEYLSLYRAILGEKVISNVAGPVHSLARGLFSQIERDRKPESRAQIFKGRRVAGSVPRVLTQMRSSAYSSPGGDTVAMKESTKALKVLGVDVEIDLLGTADPADYDIVHLYNFSTPEDIEPLARRASASETPFVVTTLFEQWPSFFNQMGVVANVQRAYVTNQQPLSLWHKYEREMKVGSDSCVRCSPPANPWSGSHASAFLASGKEEESYLQSVFGPSVPVYTTHFGIDFDWRLDQRELERSFREWSNIEEDFILCVGRIELRKNQVSLLKALEDDSRTVVFASGGFSYQPDYDKLAREFRRRGKTIFLPRMERAQLIGAYCAAKVHALPSWYELPGLVTLEAAAYGCRVVATSRGTLPSYLQTGVHYCEPDDVSSILRAVDMAWSAGPDERLASSARAFTWERCAKELLAAFQEVLRREEINSGSSEQALAKQALLSSMLS